MRLLDNFLTLVRVDTTSDENSLSRPSSDGQRRIVLVIKDMLSELDMHDVYVGSNGTLYAKLAASTGFEHKPALGFIAHVDTSDSCSGDVNPQIHHNYRGGPIEFLTGDLLDPKVFTSLEKCIGETLITSDGTSLLGADDKAGIAEIIELLYVLKSQEIAHPTISVAFTTDEEIGAGADGFEQQVFGAQYAFTVDGGIEGSIEYETFNAATAEFAVKGVSTHTGSAKGRMVNAADIAARIACEIPAQRPENTAGYEGFYHIHSIDGNVSAAKLTLLIRDHDHERFEDKKRVLESLTIAFKKHFGDGSVTLSVKDTYLNMRQVIEQHRHLIDNAKAAIERCGLQPITEPVRGGTDGAKLSFEGLPCPNLGTGGHAFHSKFEHITVQAMQRSVAILVEIAKLYADG